MAITILAGIVDRHGGIRVVVTAQENIHYHVAEGERLYVVPNFFADDLVSGGQYVALIDMATKYVKSREAQS